MTRGHARPARAALAALLGASLLLVHPAAASDEVVSGDGKFSVSETFIDSSDGTRLHTYVMRPLGLPADVRTPVVVQVTPYNGQRNGTTSQQEPLTVSPPPALVRRGLAERGYTYVEVSMRGFGGSGGCWDLGGPGEQQDAVAAVEWAAAQPWSNGRVGTFGESYPGLVALMPAAHGAKGLAAMSVIAAGSSIYEAMWTNGVRQLGATAALGPAVYGFSIVPAATVGDPESTLNQAASAACLEPDVQLGLTEPDANAPFWRERDLTPALAGSVVPVLASAGTVDPNARVSGPVTWMNAMGGDRTLWIGQYGHPSTDADRSAGAEVPQPVTGRDPYDDTLAMFDRYLKHGKKAVPAGMRTIVQRGDGLWRDELAWPPRDVADRSVPLTAGAYVDLPAAPALRSAGPVLLTDRHLSGAPRLTLDTTAAVDRATAAVRLYDVAPDGTAVIVTRGAAALPVGAGRTSFDLLPQDWLFRAGHRLVVEVASTDLWYVPGATGTIVSVRGGRLDLPELKTTRDTFFASTEPTPHGATGVG